MADKGERPELSIEQVEADIRLCEEILARDTLEFAQEENRWRRKRHDEDGADSSKEQPSPEDEKPKNGVPSFMQTPASGVDKSSMSISSRSTSRLSDNRRHEILQRLEKERKAREQTVRSGDDFQVDRISPAMESAPPPSSSVSQSLFDRSEARRLGQDERDEIIARLMREREKKQLEASSVEPSKTLEEILENASPVAVRTESPEKEEEQEDDEPVERSTADTSGVCKQHVEEMLEDTMYANQSESRIHRGHYTVPKEFKAASTKPQNRNAKELIVQQVQQQIEDACTFKPKIITYSSKEGKLTRQQRIERLAKSREKNFQKWEQRRMELQKKEEVELTFKPKTNKRRVPAMRDHIPFEERLYHDGDDKIVEREQKKRQREEDEYGKHAFRPQLVSSSDKYLKVEEYKPLHERVGDLQRRKNERLHSLRMQHEKDMSHTFSPSLDAKSLSMVQKRGLKPATARLFEEKHRSLERRMQLEGEWNRQMSAQYTFRPEIDKNSERIIQESEAFAGARRDFLERQNAWLKKKKGRHEADKELLDDAEMEPYKPRIGKTSELLALSKRSMAGETEDEKLERLTHRDMDRIRMLRESVGEQYYSQFKYKPEIDRISKAIGRKSTFEDLHKNDRSRRVRENAVAVAEDVVSQECTFKPKLQANGTPALSAKSKVVFSDPKRLLRNIEDSRKEKEHRLEDSRRQLEFERMKECTFQPRVKRSQVKDSEPVLVKGLGRFMERKNLAQRMKEEQKEREEKAFLVKAGDASYPFTIPKPFKFHTDYNSEIRKVKLQEELKRREMQECTFRPKTNESENRRLIEQILRDEDED